MELEQFNTKELYDICLKATSNLEIGGRTFLPGEVVLHFDELQLSALTEQKSRIAARGGYSNATQVMWDNPNAVEFICEKGVTSKTGMAILYNSELTDNLHNSVTVSQGETIETDIDGKLTLKFTPLSTEFFIYDENLIPVLTGFTRTGTVITGLTPYKDYTIRYLFTHTGDANILTIGRRLFNGYLKLVAKMRLKDDIDGLTKTGILEIPHVRLMSDLSIRLGSEVTPNVSVFRLQGDPVGERNNQYLCQIIYLDTDIDSDII